MLGFEGGNKLASGPEPAAARIFQALADALSGIAERGQVQ